MMADFPYVHIPTSIGKFFPQIQNVGKPSKVTTKWLECIGFKSKNDRDLRGLLISLGFIDSSGVPKDRWMAYRNKQQSKQVMAEAIQEAYSQLFQIYPDAYRKDDEALRNFFTTNSALGQVAIGLIVRTFKALVQLADFSQEVAMPFEVSIPRENPLEEKDIDDYALLNTNTPPGRFQSIVINPSCHLG